ncbi:hypothetical protein RhiirA4_430719 [Rhizophagus irregularis]|uniref:Uncharacterized protein n=1 Tax=Rhizophagus irregularis TaxID=588596 RepID=A0A2I1HLV8_9GLOM|nr:hypothetical protein RhiirA4_430719 [Rhizophagus irregularis]
MVNIHYILRWNGISIEQSPRKFISQLSKVHGFEKFFNLAQNIKYRRNSIDWKLSFNILSGSEASNTTTFRSSDVKAQKLKFLLKELLTTEQIKKSIPEIYDYWLYPSCNNEKETFGHIWSCICHVNTLYNILLSLINSKITQTCDKVSIDDIKSIEDIWICPQNNLYLTYIDFIKGFIPLSLTNFLTTLPINNKDVYGIIAELHDYIYNNVMERI